MNETWGMVCLVYLVYLVCLVGRIGSPTRRTKETRQTEQTGLLILFASWRFQKCRGRGILRQRFTDMHQIDQSWLRDEE